VLSRGRLEEAGFAMTEGQVNSSVFCGVQIIFFLREPDIASGHNRAMKMAIALNGQLKGLRLRPQSFDRVVRQRIVFQGNGS
jgi:hypothetical protein